jgi:hypothetical protein
MFVLGMWPHFNLCYFLKYFKQSKEHSIWTSFGTLFNFDSKIQNTLGFPITPKVKVHLGILGVPLLHSHTLHFYLNNVIKF